MAFTPLSNSNMEEFTNILNNNFKQLFDRDSLFLNGTAYSYHSPDAFSSIAEKWDVRIWVNPSTITQDLKTPQECFIEGCCTINMDDAKFVDSGARLDAINNPSGSAPNPYLGIRNKGNWNESAYFLIRYPVEFTTVNQDKIKISFSEPPAQIVVPRTNYYSVILHTYKCNSTSETGTFEFIRPYLADEKCNAQLVLNVFGKGYFNYTE